MLKYPKYKYFLFCGDIMASTKDFLNYVIEQLRIVDGITYRPMMGEYILYRNGLVIGGIYDDRLLVKKTSTNLKYDMEEELPYDKGSLMYLVKEIDDIELLKNIILDTYNGLKK